MQTCQVLDDLWPLIAVMALAWLAMILSDPDGSLWRQRFELEQRYEEILTACTNGLAFQVGSSRFVMCYPEEVSHG